MYKDKEDKIIYLKRKINELEGNIKFLDDSLDKSNRVIEILQSEIEDLNLIKPKTMVDQNKLDLIKNKGLDNIPLYKLEKFLSNL